MKRPKTNSKPKQNTNNCIKIRGKNNKPNENLAPVIIITINNAPKENNKLTKELPTFETVNIYLGTYVFLIKDALPLIDQTALLVDSTIKLKITCPEIK